MDTQEYVFLESEIVEDDDNAPVGVLVRLPQDSTSTEVVEEQSDEQSTNAPQENEPILEETDVVVEEIVPVDESVEEIAPIEEKADAYTAQAEDDGSAKELPVDEQALETAEDLIEEDVEKTIVETEDEIERKDVTAEVTAEDTTSTDDKENEQVEQDVTKDEVIQEPASDDKPEEITPVEEVAADEETPIDEVTPAPQAKKAKKVPAQKEGLEEIWGVVTFEAKPKADAKETTDENKVVKSAPKTKKTPIKTAKEIEKKPQSKEVEKKAPKAEPKATANETEKKVSVTAEAKAPAKKATKAKVVESAPTQSKTATPKAEPKQTKPKTTIKDSKEESAMPKAEEKKANGKEIAKKAPAKAVKETEKKAPAKTETKDTVKKATKTKDVEETIIVEGEGRVHGKFVIKKTDKGHFVFKLYSSNARVIAIGAQAYTDLKSCKGGITSVINNAAKAPIENQTLQKYEVQKCPKWEIFKDKKEEYRLRLIASNGNIVATTNDGYVGVDGAKNGIAAVGRACVGASIVRNDNLW